MNELLFQDYFAGMSIVDIENKYQISNVTLYNRLRRESLPRRKRVVKYPNRKDDFLKNIDSSEKAYLLGLIASDGCVTNPKIRIQLQEEDCDILRYFAKTILGEDSIKVHNPGKRSVKKFGVLCINSKMMCEDLATLEILPRKSLICHPAVSHLSDDLFRDFILGVFDGDGSIAVSYRKGRRPSLYFTLALSPSFALEVKQRMENLLNITLSFSLHKCINGNLAYLRCCKQKSIGVIRDWLYGSSSPCLLRKKNLFSPLPDKTLHSQDEL